jgi:hypothetical protein
MATQAQIVANRRNAEKATGPRSAEGKAIVSQNSVTHGLTSTENARLGGASRSQIIYSESQAEFELYRDEIVAELAPVGPMESALAERIVSLLWRLKRAGRIQNQTIDAIHADQINDPLAKLTQSLLPKALRRPQADPSAPGSDLTLGRLAIKDFSNARVLERLLLYERRIENSLYRTILELQRLSLIRKLKPGDEETGDESVIRRKL